MECPKKDKNKFKISNIQSHRKNLSNTIKRPLHFLNFINKKENTTSNSKIPNQKKILHKTSDGFLYNQTFFGMNKKSLNSVKSIKVGDKISLHKNKSNNQKLNSITLSKESLIKAPSQFLAYKYLRPNSIKEKYDIVMINKPYKSINTNNYIINTLNVSEKNFANNSVIDKKNLEKDYNKYKKEKEELDNKIKEQKLSIEKLIERNKKLDDKFNEVSQENSSLKKKYEALKENQEQLIMLIKIIQENGVDVDSLIDKWNNEVEMENRQNEGGDTDNTKSVDIEIVNEHKKYEFLPITVDNSKKSKNVIKGVPKLNFEGLKK